MSVTFDEKLASIKEKASALLAELAEAVRDEYGTTSFPPVGGSVLVLSGAEDGKVYVEGAHVQPLGHMYVAERCCIEYRWSEDGTKVVEMTSTPACTLVLGVHARTRTPFDDVRFKT